AEEDKKKKDEVETKNRAETTLFETEKLLKESGDKFEEADKQAVEEHLAKLRDSHERGDLDAMKADMEALSQAVYKASEAMYKKTQEAQAPEQHEAPPQPEAPGTYEADFKDVGGDAN
ncbi:MAG TPA: Hsp70 family protein, partial [Clostridiaceae bacterium]|nr:Hsp70 family protein [Clostridiaceae bacterium]